MTPFEQFRTAHEHLPPLELIRMLYDLSASWERVLAGGGDRQRRARTARAVEVGR